MKRIGSRHKLAALAASAVLVLGAFSGCAGKSDDKTIVVGASPTPHAQILEAARAELEAQGYKLEVKEFSDYVQPNLTLQNKELDANYFQHLPYLEKFNDEHNTDLVSAGVIHYEPYGLYPGKAKSIDTIPEGGTIAVPNDASNEARALVLLEQAGLIKLKEGAGLNATAKDIAENPKNLTVKEIEAAQLPRSLSDVDAAVINGNYAIEAGLSVSKDALATEDADGPAAKQYGNILAVRKGDEDTPKTKALLKALQSDTIRDYINSTYDGAVVPLF